MGDPLYADGIDLAVLLIVFGKVLVVFAFLMVAVMFMVWFERKVISDMQSRIGPNRAGPWGIGQTLADGIKLFFKEALMPDRADRKVFLLAPFLSIVPAFLTFAVVPFGGEISIAGHRTQMQLADPPVGVLFLLAMSGIAVYGVMLAGWASGSKYPLLGSVRASAQMVSYEAAMSLAIAAVVLTAGSLSTRDIVIAQEGYRWNLVGARRGALRHLPHRRHRGDEPAALRSGGGRAGAGRRLPHRVLLDQLRPLLPGRVHEHRHRVGGGRHPVPGRAQRPRDRLPAGPVAGGVVHGQAAGVPLRLRVVPRHAPPFPL